MSAEIVQGSLNELRTDLKQTWSKLSDDDLAYLSGGVDQIIDRVQTAYGFTRDRAEEEFIRFKNQHQKYFRDNRDFINTKENNMATATPLSGRYEANKLRNRAQHLIEEDIIDPAKEYMEKARDLGAQVVDRTSGMVRENPGYAILGAATVGFLAGAYFFRRRH